MNFNQANNNLGDVNNIEIKEVEILRVQPGDVIVYTTPVERPENDVDMIVTSLAKLFPHNQVIVLTDGDKLSVVKEGQA